MRYAIFIMNKRYLNERVRIEKIAESMGVEDLKIPYYADYFFLASSDLESEEEVLNSITFEGGEIVFSELTMEGDRIYIPGHAMNHRTVINGFTGEWIDIYAFRGYNVKVLENI